MGFGHHNPGLGADMKRRTREHTNRVILRCAAIVALETAIAGALIILF